MSKRKTQPEDYRLMLATTVHRYCWLCGRTERDRPEYYHGPWQLERMHIVSHPRREDRRAVILACAQCHKRQHGERIYGDDGPPQLELPQLLTIKAVFDGAHYDREWLARHTLRRLPEAEALTPAAIRQLSWRHPHHADFYARLLQGPPSGQRMTAT